MEDIVQKEAALMSLEVSVTNSRELKTTYNTLQAWFPMKLTMHKVAICQGDDYAGACYFNSDKVLVVITIITSSYARVDQTLWLDGEQGKLPCPRPSSSKNQNQ